jgi:hypothetical protein
MSEIVDLILPEPNNKAKALEKLNKKYSISISIPNTNSTNSGYMAVNIGSYLQEHAREYVKALDEIENQIPVYNQEYWQEVAKINQLYVTNDIRFEFYNESLHFVYKGEIIFRKFMYDEIEIIKDTYKYLQRLKKSEQTNENSI